MDVLHKTVRFCQVAKLIFTPDGKSITYLEEYAQSTSASRFNWPQSEIEDLSNTSDAMLWNMVRNEPKAFATQGKQAICNKCTTSFVSRSQLFIHLRSSKCGSEGKNNVNDSKFNPPSVGIHGNLIKLCVSCSYSTRNIHVNDIELKLKSKIVQSIQMEFPYIQDISIQWAAPPRRAKHAAINVAAFSVPETMLQSVENDLDRLMMRWNQGIQKMNQKEQEKKEGKKETKNNDAIPRGHSFNPDLFYLQPNQKLDVVIRRCNKVDRGFSPQNMCEFEKYQALVPLSLLCKNMNTGNTRNNAVDTVDIVDIDALGLKLKSVVHQFSGVERSFHNFTTMKLGSGKKTTVLQLRRVRSCGLKNGATNGMLKDGWLTITVPLKYHLPNIICKIIGCIVATVSGEMSEIELENLFHENVLDRNVPCYPSELIYLISPNLSRYESKQKIKCTLNRLCGKDLSFNGINLVDELGLQILKWEEEEDKAKKSLSNQTGEKKSEEDTSNGDGSGSGSGGGGKINQTGDERSKDDRSNSEGSGGSGSKTKTRTTTIYMNGMTTINQSWVIWKAIVQLEKNGLSSDLPIKNETHALTHQVIAILKQWANQWAGRPEWQSFLNKSSLLHEIEETIIVLHSLLKWMNNKSNSDKTITIVDVCSGKGVFSMVASYLFVHDLRVSKIVMLDKAIINWNHITAVNETAAEEQRPVIESWNGCNLHQVDTVVDRLEALKTPLCLVGIHLCKLLTPTCIGIVNTLGASICPFLCLAPCCLPSVVTKVLKKTKGDNSSKSTCNHVIEIYQNETKQERTTRTQAKQRRQDAVQRRPTIACFLCQSMSHPIHRCPSLPVDEKKKKVVFVQASKLVPCWKCGEVGHFKIDCTSTQPSLKPTLIKRPIVCMDVANVAESSKPFDTYCELLTATLQRKNVQLIETGLITDRQHQEENYNGGRKSIYIVATDE